MVFYKELFLEEGLDAIQDGQDTSSIGNDLDQIADDVLESHDDEIEYADEVPDINPVDEAFKIMSDAEHNYNQLKRAIGLTELHAFSTNRDVVLEAVDIKGFFARVKEMFMSMFQSISKVIKNVLTKLDIQVKLDAKFINKHKKNIQKGNNKKWSHKGFKYDKTMNFVGAENLNPTGVNRGKEEAFKMDDVMKASIIARITSKNVTDVSEVSEMKKKLIAYLRGGEEPIELKGVIDPNEIINILSNARETSKIKDDYAKLKKDYDRLIKDLEKQEKELSKSKFEEGSSLKLKSLNIQISMAKFEKNAQNVVQVVFLQIAKEKRNQARKIAHKLAGLGKKEDTAVGESGSLFESLSFV